MDYGSCLKVVLAALGIGVLLGLAIKLVFDQQQGGSRPPVAVERPSPPASPTGRVTCPGATGGQPALVSFRDPGFPSADWSDTALVASLRTATFAVTRVADGGPDGRGYRTVQHVFAGSGVIATLHLQRAAVYDADACGPISSIDVGYAVENLGPSQQLFLFVVRQGGVVYNAPGLSVTEAGWTPVTVNGLRASAFTVYAGDGPPHPDFSAGRLEFGYVMVNSCGAGLARPCATTETTSAMGAWYVAVRR